MMFQFYLRLYKSVILSLVFDFEKINQVRDGRFGRLPRVRFFREDISVWGGGDGTRTDGPEGVEGSVVLRGEG